MFLRATYRLLGFLVPLFLILTVQFAVAIGLGAVVHWVVPAIELGSASLLSLTAIWFTAWSAYIINTKLPSPEDESDDDDTCEEEMADRVAERVRDLLAENRQDHGTRRRTTRRPSPRLDTGGCGT